MWQLEICKGPVQQYASKKMIGAYIQYGCAVQALNLFFDMLVVGFVPDKATFVSVIGACESVII